MSHHRQPGAEAPGLGGEAGDVAAADQLAAHVDACRVAQRDAFGQQALGVLALMDAFEFGQLRLVVHAQRFRHARRLRAHHRNAVAYGGGDHVGQVVLALGVVVRQLVEPAGELAAGHDHDAGVHFADGALGVGGILLLDDAHDAAFAVAHDAAIAGRVVEADGEDGELVVAGRFGQLDQRVGAQQRHVAVKYEYRLVARQMRQRLADRVTGAELLGLQRPVDREIGEGRAHCVATVAVHHAGVRRVQGRCGAQHMPEQRAVRQGLQHLGQGGAHALALPGCQNDDLHRTPYGGKPRGF